MFEKLLIPEDLRICVSELARSNDLRKGAYASLRKALVLAAVLDFCIFAFLLIMAFVLDFSQLWDGIGVDQYLVANIFLSLFLCFLYLYFSTRSLRRNLRRTFLTVTKGKWTIGVVLGKWNNQGTKYKYKFHVGDMSFNDENLLPLLPKGVEYKAGEKCVVFYLDNGGCSLFTDWGSFDRNCLSIDRHRELSDRLEFKES